MSGFVSSGSCDFDKWLGGGYEKGVVTMFVGGPGSGKSNFAMLCAAWVAKKEKVVFIDSEGGFSVERIKQICGKNYLKVLENIVILSPLDFEEQRRSFEKLNKYLKGGGIGLVVVDSVAMHYRLEMGLVRLDADKISGINSIAALQMKNLVEIARREKLAVLVTNQVYFEFSREFDFSSRKMGIVGGDLFKYWSKCIIELRDRRAKLIKHRFISRDKFYFEIRDKGIFKKRGIW